MKVRIKKSCTVDGEDYEKGEVYNFDGEKASKMIDEDVAEKLDSEAPSDELKKYLSSRGFSKNPEKNIWSKTVNVDGKEVNLIRDFERSEKGAKMAIDANTDESLSEVAENHPDQKYLTLLREGDVSLESAVTSAESEAKKYKSGREQTDEIGSDLGENMDMMGNEGQQMAVQMQPALELDKEETTEKIESDIINGLTSEDLDELVWDPEEENVPYDKPMASADAYELFARIMEMALGVQYSVIDHSFRRNKEQDTFECDVTIERQSRNPRYDGKIMKGFKTRLNMGTRDHWRERLYTKAKRNALKSEIPKVWISRLLRRYKNNK